MTVETLLNLVTQIIFLIVSGSTLLNWARQRNQTNLDIALVFISFALAIISQDLQGFFPKLAPFLAVIFFVSLLTQPYLLLRVVQYFRPIPVIVRRAMLIGLILVFACFVFVQAAPILVFILAVSYFVIGESYASFLLIQGANTLTGILGKRLKLASIGAISLAIVFILALVVGVNSLIAPNPSPVLEIYIAPLIQIIAVISGLGYYFGFSPPRWLVQTWQLTELHNFLRQTATRTAHDSHAILNELSEVALRTVGGATAVIAICDMEGKQLTIDIKGSPPLQIENVENLPGAIGQAWREQTARVAYLPNETSPQVNDWGQTFGARALLIMPMISERRPWGLLIVALRYMPLFAQDDLDLLALFVRQSAISLEFSELVAETRRVGEERYHQVLDNMLEGAQIIGYDWRYLYVNDAVINQGKMTREDLIGHTILDVYPGIENTALFVALRECMRDRVAQHMENKFNYPDGSSGWFELSIQPVQEGIFILSMDITRRKQAEEKIHKLNMELDARVAERTAQLKESEEKFSKAFLNSPVAVSIASMPDGRYINVNEALARLTGYSREELLGHTSVELGLVDSTAREKILDATRIHGFARNVEIQIHTKSKQIAEVLTSIEQIEIGGQPCLLSVNYDITERKRAESQVQQLNRNLELRQSELEAVNKELEAFSYSVSHDLRAPLRSIDGFSQALLEDYGDLIPEDGHLHLDRVRANAQRMAQLIDDMLDLSRVTRAAMEKKQIDLSNIVEEIMSGLQQENPERHVFVSITPNLIVEGDIQLLRIALLNLLNNAWKFTSKKKEAQIEFGVHINEGQRTFFVRDNGAGFDMTYADKLFGAFQRLHSMEEFSGTGVGLATVKRIITRHGGQIWAESTLNEGATFYFAL